MKIFATSDIHGNKALMAKLKEMSAISDLVLICGDVGGKEYFFRDSQWQKLVGKGDMLYAPLGQGKPQRVQGCFISAEEIDRVVSWRQMGRHRMMPASWNKSSKSRTATMERRLKLGYSRAARIIDMLEERGIVGPFEGSKPRKILITREAWKRRKDAPMEDIPL